MDIEANKFLSQQSMNVHNLTISPFQKINIGADEEEEEEEEDGYGALTRKGERETTSHYSNPLPSLLPHLSPLHHRRRKRHGSGPHGSSRTKGVPTSKGVAGRPPPLNQTAHPLLLALQALLHRPAAPHPRAAPTVALPLRIHAREICIGGAATQEV